MGRFGQGAFNRDPFSGGAFGKGEFGVGNSRIGGIDANTVFITQNFTNGQTTFIDSETAGTAKTITNIGTPAGSNAVILVSPNASILLNGSADGIRIADDVSLHFSGDFTFEIVVYITGSFAATPTLMNKGNESLADGIWWCTTTSGNIQFFTNGVQALVSVSAISMNTKYHLALVRSGSTITQYINGVADGTVTNNANIGNNAATWGFGIYTNSGPTNFLGGRVDVIRLSKVARWTSNFTPPTVPYTT